MGGTGGRARGPGLSLIAAATSALPALISNLAVEVAPIRVYLIAAGFVDTPLSASRCSAISWTRVASSFARRCRSGA
jgi:NAD(P)-dependent dehydrogenase (short-subunit alcohol dehydrogenase family)